MAADPHLLKLLVRILWEVSLWDPRRAFQSLLVLFGAPLYLAEKALSQLPLWGLGTLLSSEPRVQKPQDVHRQQVGASCPVLQPSIPLKAFHVTVIDSTPVLSFKNN